ncbi:hypothetical protein BsWGS_00229 [Bradybaena similaris]
MAYAKLPSQDEEENRDEFPKSKNKNYFLSKMDITRCSLRTLMLALSVTANIALLATMTATRCWKTQENQLNCDTNQMAAIVNINESTENFSQTVCPEELPPCDAYLSNDGQNTVADSKYANVFEDLSASEISSVFGYLASQDELNIEPRQTKDAAHVYLIELQVPNKTDALNFLDGKGSKPAREARVIVERSDLDEPVVEEYVVGPLPLPQYHYLNPRRQRPSIPYRFHPTYGLHAAYTDLFNEIPDELNDIIRESYGTTFKDCRQDCLVLLPEKTSSAYSDATLIILTAYYSTDFTTINPVGLLFVMTETKKDSQRFQLHMLIYEGRVFKSVAEFVQRYQANSIPKAKLTFPRPGPNGMSVAGTMNIRGRIFPEQLKAGPMQFDPHGKRYKVSGQRVQYLEWSFSFRMSAMSGPQVWDVRWAGQRIAFEISLQELVVLYAGANPKMFYSHLSDSAFGLGDKASGLVPGVDCPEHATFLPQTIFKSELNGPKTLPNAFCLFEHNSGVPLRRHRSDTKDNGRNYGGLVDRVLILRTIIVEYNYDYIFDLVFHQNGAIEVKTYATGYVMSQIFQEGETPFGFRIHEKVVGSIHHHLVNFKIDLDIQGQSNRYATLDFLTDKRPWPWYRTGHEPFQQISFQHRLKHSEQEAVLRYNFSTPKYHIVYNEQARNKFGNHRAYRIAASGFTKQILPDASEVLRSRRWTQYQMSVSKRKDNEESSSSIFSMFDGENPVVDFDRHLQDNESIVDQDLVLWATVGFLHLPHTEDIPNTPTAGPSATIYLLPYNYFPECPSVGSRDAVRLDASLSEIVVQDYGIPDKPKCAPKSVTISNLSSQKASLFP